jgi:hypothetical protein
MLPYPSDFFLADDASMPSGKRVAITPAAKPLTKSEEPFDFTDTHPADGFSPHMPILAYFPRGVSTEGVVFHTDDPAKSMEPTSKVLLVDAETGKALPVWAEVDMNTNEPSERAFIVRSFARLENQHRYIVAFQGLAEPTESGGAGPAIEAPKGFARIRDGKAASDPVLEPIGARYEKEIFPALTGLGIARDKLQLAWDFTTSSEESNTRDMLAMRADLLPKLLANPPAVTIDKVIEKTLAPEETATTSPSIALRIEGTIRVPLYLESDKPGARLFRDASGKVVANGEAEVPFTMQVPHSAMPADASFTPATILEYGHGFFGSREEINYGSFMRPYSNERGYITIAVDWWGMSEDDFLGLVPTLLSAPGQSFDFVDRLHQAMANFIALSYAVKGPLTQIAAVKRFDKPLYDPDKLYYYGISQGSIFGVTMLSLSPTLDRAALGVGGGPYSLMMSRSASYAELYALLRSSIDVPLTLQKFMAMSQGTWDRVDPITYAPHLLLDRYPGTPERHVLMQIGIGDHSVNNLASHLVARAAGVPLLEPSPRPIWGLESVQPPTDDALVVVDFKLATEPGVYSKLPGEDEKNDVHESVRHNEGIKDQLDAFFRPNGQIENFCQGACDPD